ncbi:MAG: hypothetical protein JW795_04435 [Chitinivibrionales bacterium]|nr:hypothetical protein [Chitinivibrionales bacterium]
MVPRMPTQPLVTKSETDTEATPSLQNAESGIPEYKGLSSHLFHKRKFSYIIYSLVCFITFIQAGTVPREVYFGGGVARYKITDEYKAVLVQATVLVDSLWHILDPMEGNRFYKKLSVVSVKPFDTSLYSPSWHSSSGMSLIPESQVSFNPSTLLQLFVDSISYHWEGIRQKDTLRDIFLLQEYFGNSRYTWNVCFGRNTTVDKPDSPFPLKEAVRSFDAYLSDNKLYKGYDPPSTGLKLGPVFYFQKGDPGWFLFARSDANYWFLTHWTGYGDCPCGCTQWQTEQYRIDSHGSVEKVTPLAIAPFQQTSSGSAKRHRIAIYDCTGRKMYESSPTTVPVAVGEIQRNMRAAGVYIIVIDQKIYQRKALIRMSSHY